MKDEQPSKQTVREILESSEYVDQAEAAINAHIVSVLEGVHKQCDSCEGGRRIIVYASGDKYEESEYEYCDEDLHTVIDAAIAKYKQEPKS